MCYQVPLRSLYAHRRAAQLCACGSTTQNVSCQKPGKTRLSVCRGLWPNVTTGLSTVPKLTSNAAQRPQVLAPGLIVHTGTRIAQNLPHCCAKIVPNGGWHMIRAIAPRHHTFLKSYGKSPLFSLAFSFRWCSHKHCAAWRRQ